MKTLLKELVFVPTKIETIEVVPEDIINEMKIEVSHLNLKSKNIKIETEKLENYIEMAQIFGGDVVAATAKNLELKETLAVLSNKISTMVSTISMLESASTVNARAIAAEEFAKTYGEKVTFDDIAIGRCRSSFSINGRVVNLPEGEFYLKGVKVNPYTMLPLGEHVYVGAETRFDGVRAINDEAVGEAIKVVGFDAQHIIFIDADGNKCSTPVSYWVVADDNGYYKAVSKSGKTYCFWMSGLAQ